MIVVYRVFYYPGAQFDVALLIQSFIMITIQLILLKVALDHRPGPSSKGGEASTPFAGSQDNWGIQRPYNFWQWRSPKPYVFSSLSTQAGLQFHHLPPHYPNSTQMLTVLLADTGNSSCTSSSPSSLSSSSYPPFLASTPPTAH
jgi:hypothetical protein